MIYTNGLMSSIDSLFNSNMFLKDEYKVGNLKGEINNVFSEVSAEIANLNNLTASNAVRINSAEERSIANRDAIILYLRENIETCKRCLNTLGEWY